MNLTIIDGYTLNPGDLSWKPVSDLAETTIFDRTLPEEIIDRCQNAKVIITNKIPFSEQTLEQLPDLQLIIVSATGYNIINTKAAKSYSIKVCNVPAYGTASVAQHTFALLLELTNRVGLHAESVKNGEWVKSPDFCYTKSPILELAGKTIGIVGFGNIGKQTAQIARAFGMKILYYNPRPISTALGEFSDLERLFSESDVISLHCPLTPQNEQFVNKKLLKLMKNTAFFINTSRGQLVHEQDLTDALNTGLIAGAGLDVLSTEPPTAENPLLGAKNCIITPHNAWVSREARQRIILMLSDTIKAFISGKPINVVNA